MRRRWTLLLLWGCGSCLDSSPADAPDLGGGPPRAIETATVAAEREPLAVASSSVTKPRRTDPEAEGTGPSPPEPGRGRAPRWVREDLSTPGVLFGVGSVKGVANRGLARITAENRARADLIRKLGVGEREAVSGIDIVDHWTDPRSGAMFARARFFVGPTAE